MRELAAIAHYTGLATCGSINGCPVCGPNIRNKRAIEISSAAGIWDNAGNVVLMMGLTFPHDRGDRLADTYDLIANGFRYLIGGRPWRTLRDRYNIAGTIRAVECTYGCVFGWHPHAHVLIMLRGELGEDTLGLLTLALRERWNEWITRHDYRMPSDEHGVVIEQCRSAFAAGQYIAKEQNGKTVGAELARGDLKQGSGENRMPFEILGDYCDADPDSPEARADLLLWQEWEQVSKGRKAITWSKGLRAEIAGLGNLAPEQTDEEIAAAEVGGTDIATIPAPAWSAICGVRGLAAAVLDAAETDGLAGINTLLDVYLPPGVPLAADPSAARIRSAELESWEPSLTAPYARERLARAGPPEPDPGVYRRREVWRVDDDGVLMLMREQVTGVKSDWRARMDALKAKRNGVTA